MDYIRTLGPLVLDHRFRRLSEALLRAADETYAGRKLPFRARWASTYTILRDNGPTPLGELALRLMLTHPALIGITDEMIEAGVAVASRDKTDGRRRILALTPKGREMNAELTGVWQAMSAVQGSRFKKAGCDIVAIIDSVEDGMATRSVSSEVLERIASKAKSTGESGPKRTTTRRLASAARIFAFVLASMLPLSRVAAQSSASIGSVERAALIKAVSDSLIGGYIYEKTGRLMADSLNSALRAGAFDQYSDGKILAQKITEILGRIGNDRHLGVSFAGPPREGAVMRRVVPGATASPGAQGSAAEYGFGSAQILPGNIGYLDIPGFSGDPEALRATDSIMQKFTGVKALVIDLGRNRGGGPLVIQHLSAYFFAKPTHLVSTFMRGMDAPRERWTSEHAAAGKLAKIPVYILTSRRSISAAESFAFGLRANNRVTIVGEPTAGGGHFGGFIQVAPGFSMFLPRGRTYDPRTDQGWEAEGLRPDVEVPYEKALETALELARKS